MSTIKSSTTTTTAYSVTADTTGTLVIQTGSTPTTAVTVGTDQSVTFAQAANLPNTFGFKNRIINGAMVIDQRNAGASVTPANGAYTLDRFRVATTQSSKFTLQQNAGSVTPPAGFKNYLGITSSSAYSVLSSDYFLVGQPIEGFNTSDLGFGAAGASTITLSFWVRSSLTGTFGGSINNSAYDRSYSFSYTISAANTWEQKSVTIAGDTTGTWIGATNGVGLYLWLNLGTGSTGSTTANAWAAGSYYAPTGATSVVGTNGATFYITGVQLEKGSTATSFDYRPYGTELALCQRYLPCMNGNTGERIPSIAVNTAQVYSVFNFGVEPRVPPTGITVTTVGNFSLFNYRTGAGTGAITAIVYAVAGKLTGTILITTSSVAANDTCHLYPAASGQILFTGCEL